MPRHFLTGTELTSAELDALLERAAELKRDPLSSRALEGKSVGLVFQKPSTRTRVSFEVGISELGGHALVLRADELQLSRGEALRDTAIVLSRHVAAVGVRTGEDATVEELAEYSEVPVINMLTARHHPCQALADLLTLRESCGELDGLRVAYVGDGNNVARSLALLGALAGVHVVVASPDGYALERDVALKIVNPDLVVEASAIDRFLAGLGQGLVVRDALVASSAPDPAHRFVLQTSALVERGELCEIASAFAFGREDLLPDLFRRVRENLRHLNQFR